MKQERKIKLVQEIENRWNSKYDMVDAILVNKAALKSMHLDAPMLPVLTDNQFNMAANFCELLATSKEITEFLSASNYITSVMIYPVIYTLVNVELPQMRFDCDDLNYMKDDLVNILKRRFVHVLDSRYNGFYVAAAYLDIEYRDMVFIENSEERKNAIEAAKQFIVNISKDFAPTEITQQQSSI